MSHAAFFSWCADSILLDFNTEVGSLTHTHEVRKLEQQIEKLRYKTDSCTTRCDMHRILTLCCSAVKFHFLWLQMENFEVGSASSLFFPPSEAEDIFRVILVASQLYTVVIGVGDVFHSQKVKGEFENRHMEFQRVHDMFRNNCQDVQRLVPTFSTLVEKPSFELPVSLSGPELYYYCLDQFDTRITPAVKRRNEAISVLCPITERLSQLVCSVIPRVQRKGKSFCSFAPTIEYSFSFLSLSLPPKTDDLGLMESLFKEEAVSLLNDLKSLQTFPELSLPAGMGGRNPSPCPFCVRF